MPVPDFIEEYKKAIQACERLPNSEEVRFLIVNLLENDLFLPQDPIALAPLITFINFNLNQTRLPLNRLLGRELTLVFRKIEEDLKEGKNLEALEKFNQLEAQGTIILDVKPTLNLVNLTSEQIQTIKRRIFLGAWKQLHSPTLLEVEEGEIDRAEGVLKNIDRLVHCTICVEHIAQRRDGGTFFEGGILFTVQLPDESTPDSLMYMQYFSEVVLT